VFAKGKDSRIGFEHDPFIDSAASVKCEPPLELRAEEILWTILCTWRGRSRVQERAARIASKSCAD
jgi:hypothetical protein